MCIDVLQKSYLIFPITKNWVSAWGNVLFSVTPTIFRNRCATQYSL